MTAIHSYPLLWIEALTARRWMAPLVLTILSVLVIFPTLSASGLSDWDEGIYAVVARNIERTGDIVHLKLGDSPYMRKPPLYMILTAGAYSLMGETEFSTRLTSAIFGVATVLMIYLLISRLTGRVQGFVAGLLLLADAQYIQIVQHGRMESMVTFFIMLSLYALYRMSEDARWSYLFFGAIALGILTKGPLGILPLLIAIPYYIFNRDVRARLLSPHGATSLLLCIVIAAPWFYTQYSAYGWRYIDSFIGNETLKRMSSAIEGHEGSPLFYIRNISFDRPTSWAFLAPFAAALLLYDAIRVRSRELIFMACYLFVIFAVFSLAVQTKLWWYSFSFYPPMAFATVHLLWRLPSRAIALRGLVIAASLVFIVSFNWTNTPHKTSLRTLTPAMRAALGPTDTLTAYKLEFQAINFYADRDVRVLKDKNELMAAMQNTGGYFILRPEDFDQLTAGIPVTVLGRAKSHIFFSVPKRATDG